jgi:hypothetical protein
LREFQIARKKAAIPAKSGAIMPPNEIEFKHDPALTQRALLDVIDPQHPLVKLARQTDWPAAIAQFGKLYISGGAARHPDSSHGGPALPQARLQADSFGRVVSIKFHPSCRRISFIDGSGLCSSIRFLMNCRASSLGVNFAGVSMIHLSSQVQIFLLSVSLQNKTRA